MGGGLPYGCSRMDRKSHCSYQRRLELRRNQRRRSDCRPRILLQNMESGEILGKNRPKKERRLIEVAKHLHIKRREGQWGLMIPKDFDRLLKEMKKGEVVAVSAEGITEEEKEKIRAEGFSIFPQQLTVGRAPRHQAIDILNIR